MNMLKHQYESWTDVRNGSGVDCGQRRKSVAFLSESASVLLNMLLVPSITCCQRPGIWNVIFYSALLIIIFCVLFHGFRICYTLYPYHILSIHQSNVIWPKVSLYSLKSFIVYSLSFSLLRHTYIPFSFLFVFNYRNLCPQLRVRPSFMWNSSNLPRKLILFNFF
jgi:hypothetical protein